MSDPSGERTGERHTVREWRDLRGLSAQQLADAAGVSQQMLWRIEAGKSTPNILLAFALADALGVSERDILWPETARYGVGSKPSIAQADYQERKREQAREAANNQ